MARKPRIKVPGYTGVYHVVNRVAHKRHTLDRHMKQYFMGLLEKLQVLYYVKYAGFTILNNHYHLLVNFLDPEEVDPFEAMEIWNIYHKDTPYTRNPALRKDRDYVVREMTDVSSFMKRFNMHMTIHYNRTHETAVGTLWERRFRSSIMERGSAVALCGAYIELNAFRASLVKKPEDYQYSSLYHLKQGNKRGLVDTELLEEGLFIQTGHTQELYKIYLAYIYQAGSNPHKDEPDGIVVTEAMKKHLTRHNLGIEEGLLSRRIRMLLEGKITGGEDIAELIYNGHIDPGLTGEELEDHKKRWMSRWKKLKWSVFTVCSARTRNGP